MKEAIKKILNEVLPEAGAAEITVAARPEYGHYSTSVAMRLAKEKKRPPLELAEEMAKKIGEAAPAGFFEKVAVAPPGFVNFWLSKKTIQEGFSGLASGEATRSPAAPDKKRLLVEFTDPNPFKQFHIGHLMTNVIGEAIARLAEASGQEVFRVNYQGDVGVHVASSVWGMMKLGAEMPKEDEPLPQKAAFLGRAYALGATAYRDEPEAKTEIDELNKKIYERSDPAVNGLYDRGRQWSLDYFETLYARLGTKFVHYFFESEAGPDGKAIVEAHPDVFEKSDGAIIFPGEKYGLHNRVFVSKLGLPTYEAKELGLNKKKFALYHPDLSLIITGNEINDYFRVLLRAMAMTVPEAAERTRHLGHGMLRLPTGKMSSRTGDVITAESLIESVKEMVREKIKDREELATADREEVAESVALAAIRYSILKQGIGRDVVFDAASSIAFTGDSGPYLQYTYARLVSILRKAEGRPKDPKAAKLEAEAELSLVRKLCEFEGVVAYAAQAFSPNLVAGYLYELADEANGYYESTPILKDEDEERRGARLTLVGAIAETLAKGLGLLGIRTLEKI